MLNLTDTDQPSPKSKTSHTMRDKLEEYRQGAEGFISWAEDNVSLPIYPIYKDRRVSIVSRWVPIREFTDNKHPVTGRSYLDMWEGQKEILREVLRMEGGLFVYSLIIFCWMRGEGKSLLVCLILIWRFMCWPRAQIMLGANSKEQTKFVHYDIIRDVIRNSPPIYRKVGERNIQEKEIRLVNRKRHIVSLVRSISTASGIVSNITNYSFSEIFDMKNPKFFVQLDGSIRNIPNAFGLIDSTVSTKDHILFQQYEGWKEGKLPNVFFSHRFSREGRQEDYWNPYMTQEQLDGYRVKFPSDEFERYFLNMWDSGEQKPFTKEMLEETNIIAYNGRYLDHQEIFTQVKERTRLIEIIDDTGGLGFAESAPQILHDIDVIDSKLMPVDSIYSLRSNFGTVDFAPIEVIHRLSDLFKTDFSISAGLDMSDPMAILKKARTILTFVAKGLPNSQIDTSWLGVDRSSLKFVYFLLGLVHIQEADIDTVRVYLDKANIEYQGLDSFVCERWGSGNLYKWLEENRIKYDFVSPGYDRQRDAFKELFVVIREGRFKKPKLQVQGAKEEDILIEEMGVFYQNTKDRWFGSPHKDEKYGVQDDSVYSLGWNMWGSRELGPEHFRPRRKSIEAFGLFYPDPSRKYY